MRKFLKSLARMLLMLLVGGYIAFVLYAWFGAESVIFMPHASSYQDSAKILKLKSSDGNLISAVYLKNPDARFTLLYSHGNAEDMGDDMSLLEDLSKAGFNVFAYDYQGYGTSQGKPTEAHVYEDELAAYNYLTQQAGVAPSSIIVQGHSVGTGPAVDLASKKPVGGLIVESGFVSAFRVITQRQILPFDRLNNLSKIRKVHYPVLVMHGRQDNVIPFWHGEKLYAAANQPKQFLWLDRASHNDISFSGQYLPAIKHFADFVAQQQAKAQSAETKLP